ncbi:ankyrin repeat domain-containing protein [Candidatus Dependentiae bacterium]|nr:ankyrin repeat domain-containing protein [Candidatus Dependentiae bacterium]
MMKYIFIVGMAIVPPTSLSMSYDQQLLYAAKQNKRKVAEVSLKYATGNSCNNCSDTSLHYAASHKQSDITCLLLAAGANPNVCNSIKLTPLHEAVIGGNNQTVKLLLNAGANPNAQDHNGNTPLHYAVNQGFTKIIELLLQFDAHVLLKNNELKTVFDRVRELKKPELIKLIENYQLEFEIL